MSEANGLTPQRREKTPEEKARIRERAADARFRYENDLLKDDTAHLLERAERRRNLP